MKSIILILTTALLLSACETEEKTAHIIHDIQPKTYRHSLGGKPASLDPVRANSSYANFVVLNIFDTLYTYKYLKRPHQLKPNLASNMPTISEDGLVYTIPIKQGVMFHDHSAFTNGIGREVTADDVIYSIKRTFDPKNQAGGAWLWQNRITGLDDWKKDGADYSQPVEGLKSLNKYTLQIKLNKPYPQLLYTLTMGYSAIVPQEVVKTTGKEFGSQPIGSGPFIFESLDGEKAKLKKNTNFRKEPINIYEEGYQESLHGHTGVQNLDGLSPPFIDKLEIHFIPETASQWNSFTKGNEIQFTRVPKEKQNTVILNKSPLTLHPQILDKYHHSFGLEAGFVYGGFNMDDENFGYSTDPERNKRNKSLRCAIRYVHNWKQKNQAFYFGLASVFPGIIPPAVPEFDNKTPADSINQNIKKARHLLNENNWNTETLPVFEYHTKSNNLNRLLFEQMKGFLKNIGYPQNKIEYHPYASFGSYIEAIKNRKAPFFYLAWTLDYPDAENTLQLFYGPNSTPGSNNFNYKNPQFDRLFEKTQTMQPSPERTKLYQKMNKMVIDDCVALSGLSRKRIFLWHKNVIMFPDREILGGGFLRYVDVK